MMGMKRWEDETRLREPLFPVSRRERCLFELVLRLTRLRAFNDRLECAKGYGSSTAHGIQRPSQEERKEKVKRESRRTGTIKCVPNGLISSKVCPTDRCSTASGGQLGAMTIEASRG